MEEIVVIKPKESPLLELCKEGSAPEWIDEKLYPSSEEGHEQFLRNLMTPD